jgi:FAD/FMN-containing dehydrogenase
MQQASVSAAIDGVEQAEIDALGERLRGRILQPSDGDYEGARRVWNGMIDRRPGLIVQCAGTSDVVAAVELAAAHDLSVAVRGGGHNVAGTAMPDEALVVDLSPMRGVRVDAGPQTVWAQGGCTWGDVDRETQLHGLAVPGGVVSETGIAGLTLAGGYSNQRRAHGMSIDNLLACELVTADGRCLRTSESEHPELFWALRGGGGNFGVVTGFEYRAHPHGPDVYHIEVIYPIERARETLAAWRDTLAGAPGAITSDATLWAFPAIPDIPSELHGVPCLFVEAYFVGAVDEGQRELQPLRELDAPLLDLSGVSTYLELQTALDPFLPSGRRYYWKGLYLDRLDDEAIDLIVEQSAAAPSRLSPVVIRQLGGAIAQVPADATAFGDRSAPYHLSIDAGWEHPAGDTRNIDWARSFWNAAQPFSTGRIYFNFAGLLEEGENAVRTTYGPNYPRLVEAKTTYDPANHFRHNHNISPRAAGDGSRPG